MYTVLQLRKYQYGAKFRNNVLVAIGKMGSAAFYEQKQSRSTEMRREFPLVCFGSSFSLTYTKLPVQHARRKDGEDLWTEQVGFCAHFCNRNRWIEEFHHLSSQTEKETSIQTATKYTCHKNTEGILGWNNLLVGQTVRWWSKIWRQERRLISADSDLNQPPIDEFVIIIRQCIIGYLSYPMGLTQNYGDYVDRLCRNVSTIVILYHLWFSFWCLSRHNEQLWCV